MNRKLILVLMSLVLVFSLAACRGSEEEPQEPVVEPPVQEEPVEEAQEDEKERIMDEFRVITQEERASASIIKEFMDENIPVLGELEGSQMLDNLERALVREVRDVNRDLVEFDEDEELLAIIGDELEFSPGMIEQIQDQELKEMVKGAYDRHYKLIKREGQVEAIVDYSSLMEYESKVTSEWREYIELMAEESDEPAFYDGGFMITFDQLGERILRIENYMNRYVSGPRHEELLEYFESRLAAYYKGLPNTPIAAYDSGVIMENVYRSYENLAANDGYVTSGMIGEYVKAIRDNQMIVDGRILALADEYIEETVSVLREFK